MKTKQTTLLLFFTGLLAISVKSSYAQSLCDPDFWESAQPEDIDQIKEPDHICNNDRYYRKTIGMPVLHVAVIYDASPEVVQTLLDVGADPDIQNEYEETALHWAASLGRSELAQILVDADADFSIKDTDGRTALYLAEAYKYLGHEHLKVIKILMDAGAEPNIQEGTALIAKQNLQSIVLRKFYSPLEFSILAEKIDREMDDLTNIRDLSFTELEVIDEDLISSSSSIDKLTVYIKFKLSFLADLTKDGSSIEISCREVYVDYADDNSFKKAVYLIDCGNDKYVFENDAMYFFLDDLGMERIIIEEEKDTRQILN